MTSVHFHGDLQGIDQKREKLLSFGEAATHIQRTYGIRRPHPNTLWRWSSKGLAGVKLEYLKCGGTRMTSVEAIERFFVARAKRNNPRNPERSVVRAIEAEQRLQEMGF